MEGLQSNALAIKVTMIALMMKTDLLLIGKVSSVEFPDGITWKVMELFVVKWQTKDNLTLAELTTELYNVSIKD